MSKLLCAGYGNLNQRVAKRWLASGGIASGYRRSNIEDVGPVAVLSTDLAQSPWPDAGANVIVMALSARERSEAAYKAAYLEPVQMLMRSLSDWKRLPEKMIVVSSSRVYGEDNAQDVSDSTVAQTQDVYGQLLLDMENAVHQLPFPTTAVRLSGLYGPGRDWLKRMAIKADDASVTEDSWTNRIHLDDAAAAIHFLLKQETLEPSYIVSDVQPTSKIEMYNFFRTQVSLPLLVKKPITKGKRLIPSQLQTLGFEWQFPNAFSGGYDGV